MNVCLRKRRRGAVVCTYHLTVLGFVRFLASVSQLLRWLYVLLLVMSYTMSAPAAPL